ncbi:peptidoglycan/LPS O-acetylase OafA/YrhL [Micrococcus cohnii]|uniref:Peptidoglycan/LPS O-acetylase OafA/YrhL n=1 Tax=Micrococcus cohnii TaxID=993416 RepID=A0A7W7GP80_9MICC|nr:peptidoglycan/LPS O-acetylase OafA/YrhL [Micrococcus cohnii]
MTDKSIRSQRSRADRLSPYGESFYRQDIQGIRAISALMIMVYHIWINGVSGGVDVFFVISGFLVSTTLLRQMTKEGKILPLRFWSGLIVRIFPAAYLIILVTAILTLVFVPAPLWKFATNEFLASALHVENLELMRSGASYLDREAPPSQYQQFWALSIQIQFYILLPILIAALGAIIKRLRLVWLAVAVVIAVAVTSLIFSAYYTGVNPAAAYFHPAARAWEFLFGVALAFIYPYLPTLSSREARMTVSVLSFAALTALLGGGLVFGSSLDFPGVVALVPVGAALVLLVGPKLVGSSGSITRFLGWQPLAYFGGFSFSIYLWHWPFLVFTQHLVGRTHLAWWEGSIVIGSAICAAVLTKIFVEDPMLRRKRHASRQIGRMTVAIVSVAVMVAVVAAGVRQGASVIADRHFQPRPARVVDAPLEEARPAGLGILSWASVDYDRPRGIEECLDTRCVGGDLSAEKLIVIVGASHSAQYFDVLDLAGQSMGFKVVTRLRDPDYESIVAQENPDVIFDVGTRTQPAGKDATEKIDNSSDRLEKWQNVARSGVDVLLIRDNPRFPDFQNACLWKNRQDVDVCALARHEAVANENPLERFEGVDHINPVDLTDLWCTDRMCPAMAGDTFTFYDRHHLSRTRLEEQRENIVDEIQKQAPGVLDS